MENNENKFLKVCMESVECFETNKLQLTHWANSNETILENLNNCFQKLTDLNKIKTNSIFQMTLIQLHIHVKNQIDYMQKKLNTNRHVEKMDLQAFSPSDTGDNESSKKEQPDDKNNSELFDGLKVTVKVKSLNDVVGLQSVKKQLRTMVILPLNQPQLFNNFKRNNCILLFGPPGTGKTRIVHALAAESNANIYSVTPSDVMSEYVGQTEKTIKTIFDEAKKKKNCTIFIDEVDGFFSHRSSSENEHNRRLKTELLCQLTSIEDYQDVMIICATNIPWDLDSAFVRRFHQRIYVPLPNRQERFQLFEYYTQNTSLLNTQYNWESLLDMTDGYSACDIANLVRTAFSIPIMELEETYYWKLMFGQFFEPANSQDFYICGDINSLPVNSVRGRQPELRDLITATNMIKRTVSENEANKFKDFMMQ